MVYIIAIITFLLDQFLKWIVDTHMQINQSIPVIRQVLYLTYIRNPGGAFSIFPHQRWFFVVVALVVIGVVVGLNQKWKTGIIAKIAMGLVLGGALGNMADRVLSGTVVDYVYFKVINFPIFNLADTAIDVGVGLLLVYSLLQDRATNGTRQKGDVHQS